MSAVRAPGVVEGEPQADMFNSSPASSPHRDNHCLVTSESSEKSASVILETSQLIRSGDNTGGRLMTMTLCIAVRYLLFLIIR